MSDKVKNGFKILELSSKNKVSGRTYVKFIIHEIHDSSDTYNKNGISWSEQYTQQNINSAKSMPICVEFLDYERSEPFGHGMTEIKDSKPIYELSTMVGVFEDAYIESVTVNDRTFKALVGEGYINEQRYPKFVQWLKAQKFDSKTVDSSVEITRKEEHDAIVYDGGWKEFGRVPQIYDYTGHAILGIDPADDSAVLLELNNHSTKKKEDNKMEHEKVILELNSKLEDKINEINSLSTKVQEKDSTIAEQNSQIESSKQEISALQSGKAESDSLVVELNSKLTGLEEEVNSLRQFKQESDNKEIVAELNSALAVFTDKEKQAVKDKVEAFSSNPSKEGIVSIVSEINSNIVASIMEQRKLSSNNKVGDIESDVYEYNSALGGNEEVTVDELY